MKRDNTSLFYSLVFLFFFLIVLLLVLFKNSLLINLDILVNNYIYFENNFIQQLSLFLNVLFSVPGSIILILIIIGIFIFRKEYMESIFIAVNFIGVISLTYLVKHILNRARPENNLSELGFSFPSGHVVQSFIFFVLIIYLFKDKIKSTITRRVFISVNILLILLVGFSRLYLKVHWFSDILGSYLLDLFWFSLMLYLFRE